ncbi:MAG: transglutaminase-like domain-containing protein, partial [Candidatus Micrarchaeota archaeon]
MKPTVTAIVFLFLLAGLLNAIDVSPKEVGTATVTLEFKYDFSASSSSQATFKTFSYANTSFQKTQVTASMPYSASQDDYGNPVMEFKWQPNTPKTLSLNVVVQVDYKATTEFDSGADYLSESTFVKITPEINAKAALLSVGAESDLQKAVLLSEWVHQNIVYDGFYTDRVDDSATVFTERHGTCDEMSHLLIAMLRSQEISARLAGGYVYSGEAWGAHGFVQALIDGKWVSIDPTFNEFGWLDATHVLFGVGRDQDDLKESITESVSLTKQPPVIQLTGHENYPDFVDLKLLASSTEVGSSSLETLTAEAKNTDSVWRVIPLNLQVPSEPPELAVRSLEPQDKLVLLYPRQKASVEWKLLFPANLSAGSLYSFDATVRTLGKSEALTFKGKSSVEAQQQTQIELSDWFSLVKNNVLTLSFSIRNTGNTRADGELFVVLAGQSKALNISLEAGEAKTPSLDFEKPEGETASGEIQ